MARLILLNGPPGIGKSTIAERYADEHLAGGRDVIVPQYLARSDEIEAFEQVVRNRGAGFIELLLIGSADAAIARFMRSRHSPDELQREVFSLVERSGGAEHLELMYAELVACYQTRESAHVVDSIDGDIGNTFHLVCSILEEADGR